MTAGLADTVPSDLLQQRVTRWRELLDGVPALSSRYRDRHAIVLARLEEDATAEGAQEARKALGVDGPGHAASILAGIRQQARASAPDTSRTLTVQGSGRVLDDVRRIVATDADITGLVTAHRLLEQTAVPLHPSRRAHLVTIEDRELVALRWPAGSREVRSGHQQRMAEVLRIASVTAPLGLTAHEEYAMVEVEGADPWVFAPNLGQTLEDRLRWGPLDADERKRVVRSLATLRNAMTDHGVVWQGFAPRNMFLRDGQIVLIDFEEVIDARIDPVRAAECLLWHRVFFADCLTGQEAAALFSPLATEPRIPDDQAVVADEFERALLGVDTVSWRQRRELLLASVALEGRHLRPEVGGRDGGVLFGHELGHFWGDFVPVADEARLFAHLSPVSDSGVLVACLEVFEAAMEADICRSLRARAYGAAELASPRTRALVDVLDAVGPGRLAACRGETKRWYERLATDPGRMVDEMLHAAGGLDRSALDAYLIGNGDARKAHEELLATATRIGLDFLHRDDEPFLHHREPDDLRAAIGGTLDREGADLDDVLAEVEGTIARYAVSQSHRRYLAFPDSGNAVAAVAGGILGRMLNQNLIAVDRSAPSATFVEIQVIEWLRELVGYDAVPVTAMRGVRDIAGLWATGGHLSNHLAMLVALGHRFPDVRRSGLMNLGTRPTVVMAGPIAHYSHSDAAFHLGLGWDSVVSVGAGSGYTTDPAAVKAALTDPPAGTTPFMVVGVAGNCRTTGLDDLAALARICRRHGVWFHADACHGGSLIFSDRLRRRHLAGIELADSVSLDPHKGLFTPYPSSYVIFRERGMLTQFSRHETTVMADGCWDLGLITPFLGSRGFESLATWMLLRHIGTRRLGDLVESRQAHVRYLERRIEDSGLFVCLNDVDFYRLAFVFCPPAVRAALRDGADPEATARLVSGYTSRLNTALYRDGVVCFDEHTLADLDDRVGTGAGRSYTIMATCPGNPLIERSDLDNAVASLVGYARRLVGPMLAEVRGGPANGRAAPPTGSVGGPAGWSDGE
ncbi:MAG: pyridoxal-dependent decarboxylase [Mycobacteriales bacterium]